MTARQWLLLHGYLDVVELIDRVHAEWKLRGVRTRRSWWETLAGDKHGRPRLVYRVTFPVLAAAQLHEGRPVTENAIRRSADEEPPPRDPHGRTLTRTRCTPGP